MQSDSFVIQSDNFIQHIYSYKLKIFEIFLLFNEEKRTKILCLGPVENRM